MSLSDIPRRIGYSGFDRDIRTAAGYIRPHAQTLGGMGSLEEAFVYMYDAAGNMAGKSEIGRETFFRYDADDRLTASYGSGERYASYAYDAAGNIVRKQIRRLTSSYSYDRAGRMTSAREWIYGGQIPEGFNPSLVREHYRMQAAHGEDPYAQNLIAANTRYSYDGAGNLASERRTNPGAGYSEETEYRYDGLNRLREVQAEGGAVRQFAWDASDRRVYSGGYGGAQVPYGAFSAYAGRLPVYETGTDKKGYRAQTWLPDADGLTGELLHQQTINPAGRPELVSGQYTPDELSSLFMHRDAMGSAVFASDRNGTSAAKYGFSDFGEAFSYAKDSAGMFNAHSARVPEEIISRDMLSRLYTGGAHDRLSGLIHLDARFYSPQRIKFNTPDPYNFAELSLPKAVRNTLVRQTGLRISSLLRDPAQQLSNSYVSNNPYLYTDAFGLSKKVGKPGLDPIGTSIEYGIDKGLEAAGLENEEIRDTITGMAGGAVMGAAAGFKWGSAAGGIGAGPSAVAGGLIGASVGGLKGYGQGRLMEKLRNKFC